MSKTRTEEELRDAKGDVLERLADTARRGGVLPPTEKHERFIAPIFDKLAQEPVAEASPPATVAPRRPKGDPRLYRELGDAVLTLDEGQVVGTDLSQVQRPKAPPFAQRAARYAIQVMLTVPEWRAALLRATRELDGATRSARFRELVRAAARDPRVGGLIVAEAARAGEHQALTAINRAFSTDLEIRRKIQVGG